MKIFIVALLTFLGAYGYASAQLTTEEIAVVQNLFGMDKRAVIVGMIKMSPSDSVGFWPLYEKYEDARKSIGKERITLLQSFVAKYPAISNEELNNMMEKAIDLEEDQHDLLESYYSKIRKATSPLVAAQWLQLESYITSAVRLAIQENIPFVGGIKKK